jgi:ribose transport system permease protein
MLPFAAILAIAAIGQTIVVQQRGLDLSVPGMITLTTILVTRIPDGHDGRLPKAIAVILLACIASGLISGIAVAWFSITPLVATLGVNAIALGTVVKITGGSIANTVPDGLAHFADRAVLGVSVLAVLAAVLIVAVRWLTRRTVVGRRFELVGANPAAAAVAGIAVARYRVGAYVAASLCYGVAGVLLAALTSAPSLFAGTPYLLPSIAAVVLGGTSLAGGRGSVVATGIGALFLTQLDQVVLATGAGSAVQSLIAGAIVALGMGLRNVPWRRVLRAARRGDLRLADPAASAVPPVSVEPTPGA